MNDFIKTLANDELIQVCNDIYEWKNSSDGNLNPNSLLRKLYNENKDSYFSVYDVKEDVLYEAHNRFGSLVKLLFVDKPFFYVK